MKAVAARIYDPFEYLMLRHKDGRLKTDFKTSLGKVSYHVPCHLRVQNIGLKTRDVLRLVPDTTVDVIERCSGHDGTYAVKREFRAASDQDRQAGRNAGAECRARALHQRLPDGGPPDRKPAARRAGQRQWYGGPRSTASPEAAAARLRNLKDRLMEKLTAEQLFSLEQYARRRDEFRAQVLEHKSRRRLAVGPNMTWCFEDRLTIQYQIQEMLRAEKVFEPAGIQDELEAYNPLIPDGSNWKATLLLEFADERGAARAADAVARGRGALLGAGGGLREGIRDRR